LLFTAGEGASQIVSREGVQLSQVYQVGNILMDTLRANYNRLRRPAVLEQLALADQQYLVFTLNRKALIAQAENLRGMLKAMLTAAAGTPIVAPLRGLAREAVLRQLATINAPLDTFHLIDPLPYLEFGYLTAHAQGIITDSGNVAEEATFNGVACITLNSYTEHIETVKEGSNVLVGEDADVLAEYVKQMAAGEWKKSNVPDRWDGRSAERIISILLG
jgi:UDP-N-acetylglucosamine 2-epimerase (non-hydrolysing)